MVGVDMYVKDDGTNKCDDGVVSQTYEGLCGNESVVPLIDYK